MPESGHYAGQQLGNFRVVRLIGRGGYAEVYQGEQIYLKTAVAIKILNARLDRETTQEFIREARIVATLDHPHIVRVYDFGLAPDLGHLPYLVMEFAPAGALSQHRHLTLSPDLILAYVEQIAAALDFAHQQGVVHRDVKPANMLLSRREGTILLSDFGIAQLTAAGISNSLPNLSDAFAGTPAFCPPEQWQGRPVPASDQYALGVTVYRWLTGRFPFNGEGIKVALQHRSEPPPSLHSFNPAISLRVERVILRALSKDPALRYPTVGDFSLALRAAFSPSALSPQNTSQAASSPPLTDSASHPTRRSQAPSYKPAQSQPERAKMDLSALAFSDATIMHPDVSPRPESLLMPPAASSAVAATPSRRETALRSNSPIAPAQIVLARRTALTSLGLLALGGAGYLTYSLLHSPAATSSARAQDPPIGTTLHTLRTSNPVNAVAWSSRGSYLAAGNDDGTVQVWDARTGTPLHTYTGHRTRVNALAFAPDESLIASASDDATVHLWQPHTGQLARRYTGHAYSVHSVSWSPDGSTIASGSEDKTIQLWYVQTAEHIYTYQGHSNPVITASWSPNGRHITSTATVERVAIVWDVITKAVTTRHQHDRTINALAWSPDGAYIASGGEDHAIHVWDARTGVLSSRYQGHTDIVRSIAWSLDGETIASGDDDKTAQIWRAFNPTLFYRYTKHTNWVYGLAWSQPDGKLVASGGYDNTVQVWQG